MLQGGKPCLAVSWKLDTELWKCTQSESRLWEEAHRGASAGKIVLFSPWQLPFVWTNNLRREQKSSCLLNAKPQKHGAFLAQARSKFLLIPSIPDDLPSGPADWGDTKSAHCPRSPFHWAEAISLIHYSVGQGAREARELHARPGQARGWLWWGRATDNKSFMHTDALPASSVYRQNNLQKAEHKTLYSKVLEFVTYTDSHTHTHMPQNTQTACDTHIWCQYKQDLGPKLYWLATGQWSV